MAWLVTLLLTGAAAGLLTLAHLPAATLFGALLAGLVVAVGGRPRRGRRPVLPDRLNTAAQAVVGVLTGALVQPETLRALAADWLPVLASTLATLVLSLLAGLLFGLHREVDPVTGSFALVAGGASGLTAISDELGADQRVVAVVQYLRVLVIVVAMPGVAALLPAGDGSGAPLAASPAPAWADLALTAGCAVAGLALARSTRMPAGALIGPMLVTAVVAGSGLSGGATVPRLVLEAAYVAVGLQVGLSFTRESLRAVRRVLPLAVVLIVGLTAVTAAAGILLLRLAGASVLDAYLATTPGGLYAVLATAVDAGADTTLVLTVQVLRIVVMLALAPALAVLLHRGLRGSRRGRARGRGRRRDPGGDVARPRLTFTAVVLDAPDPQALGEFYGRLMGWTVEVHDPTWVTVRPGDTETGLSIQLEERYVPPVWPARDGDQQMQTHLDIEVDDLNAGLEHAVAAGATLAEFQPQRDVRVFLDPAGHPFCLWVRT